MKVYDITSRLRAASAAARTQLELPLTHARCEMTPRERQVFLADYMEHHVPPHMRWRFKHLPRHALTIRWFAMATPALVAELGGCYFSGHRVFGKATLATAGGVLHRVGLQWGSAPDELYRWVRGCEAANEG